MAPAPARCGVGGAWGACLNLGHDCVQPRGREGGRWRDATLNHREHPVDEHARRRAVGAVDERLELFGAQGLGGFPDAENLDLWDEETGVGRRASGRCEVPVGALCEVPVGRKQRLWTPLARFLAARLAQLAWSANSQKGLCVFRSTKEWCTQKKLPVDLAGVLGSVGHADGGVRQEGRTLSLVPSRAVRAIDEIFELLQRHLFFALPQRTGRGWVPRARRGGRRGRRCPPRAAPGRHP